MTIDPYSRADWHGTEGGGWRKMSYRELRSRALSNMAFYRRKDAPASYRKSLQREMIDIRRKLANDEIPLCWPQWWPRIHRSTKEN